MTFLEELDLGSSHLFMKCK